MAGEPLLTRPLTRRHFLARLAAASAAGLLAACSAPAPAPTPEETPAAGTPGAPTAVALADTPTPVPTLAPTATSTPAPPTPTPAPTATPLPRLYQQTIRIFTIEGPRISGPIERHAAAFEQDSGARLEVTRSPIADLLSRTREMARTFSDAYDCLLLPTDWLGELAMLGHVMPLDSYAQRDKALPDFQLDDIPEGVLDANRWAGALYGIPVSSGAQTLFYRKDLLDDPGVQDRYAKLNDGDAIPNPPQQLAELRKAASYFVGRDLGNGARGYGFITAITDQAPVAYYALPWVAAYSVVPRGFAPAAGIFLFAPDMSPLVNTDGFVRGVRELVEMVDATQKPRLKATREDVLGEMIRGSAAFALEWSDLAQAAARDDAAVKGKLGFAPPPGSVDYFDWQTGKWEERAEAPQVPVSAFAGWSYFVPKTAKNPDAVWEWVRYHTSPEVSAADVALAESGYQPWRRSHASALQPWTAAGWDEESARGYVQAVLDASDHPNRVILPRLPGMDRYLATLQSHLISAIVGETKSQAAMDACVGDLNAITLELGRANQVAAYRAHLGAG